jgi:hypothetical protein
VLFIKYVLLEEDKTAYVLLCVQLSATLTLPLASMLSARVGKKITFFVGTLPAILVLIAAYFLGVGESALCEPVNFFCVCRCVCLSVSLLVCLLACVPPQCAGISSLSFVCGLLYQTCVFVNSCFFVVFAFCVMCVCLFCVGVSVGVCVCVCVCVGMGVDVHA